MAYFSSNKFSKPKSRKFNRDGTAKKAPKQLKKVARKGEFWLFVSLILNKFFEKIGLARTCELKREVCDNYHLQPAHTRRRQDIRVEDWWYALRVAVACNECHFEVDAMGRRDAEPIIEAAIVERFKNLGMTESKVKTLLALCAKEVQKERPEFKDYVVIL